MTSLPFLYPRLARPLRGTVVRQFLRGFADQSSSSSSSSPSSSASPSPDTPQATAAGPAASRSAPLRVRRDPIPFELPPDIASDLMPEEQEDVVEGTITPVERQTFTKIFHDIARGKVPATNVTKKTPSAEDIMSEASNEQVRAREHMRSERRQALEDARAAAAAASIRVLGSLDKVGVEGGELAGESDNAIPFGDDAAAESDATARRLQRTLGAFPPSLRSAASQAISSRERLQQMQQQQGSAAAGDMDDNDPVLAEAAQKAAAAEAARQARQQKMEIIMLTKKTDAALWEYLESDIFSMPAEFGLRSSTQRWRDDVGPSGGKFAARAHANFMANGPLYPALLLHAVKLFGGHFGGGTTSPFTFAVLPRIKSLGLQSYVLGASTPLYNELLRIQWARLGDAVAVFGLLQEMQQAGLAFTGGTLAVLNSMQFHFGVARDANSATNIDLDGVHRPLGTVKGTSFVGAALQQLPDVGAVPSMVQWWRAQVEAGVAANRRHA